MKPRAFRRVQKARMKEKARKARPWAEKAFYLADHMANCSCVGCGNLRKIYGKSLQERRFETREIDDNADEDSVVALFVTTSNNNKNHSDDDDR